MFGTTRVHELVRLSDDQRDVLILRIVGVHR